MVIGAGVVLVGRLRSPPAASLEHIYTVQPRPFTSSISVVGTVSPADSVDVTAPFDGVVKSLGFKFGETVHAGQVLVVMNTDDLEARARETEAAYLKAAQAESDMEGWAGGTDVLRARRSVESAALALRNTDNKAAETKGLLDRGLVARSEYDGLLQQRESENSALSAAQQDLAATLKKGAGPNRAITRLELQNTKAKLAEIEAQLSSAILKAPAGGVMGRPPAGKSEGDTIQPRAGARLDQGQLIGTLARFSAFALAVKLDEADANRIRVGQAASITGSGFDGLTLSGHVTEIAGEGVPEGGAAGAVFGATVTLDPLTPTQASAVRMGMTANVTITTYQAAAAIVVPPQALAPDGAGVAVNLWDAESKQSRLRIVAVGAAAPDGVEIRSGLKPGDVIRWSDPTTPGSSTPN
ncbi:efflux RND transporter periplasmic adaptor subunit [Caulobacter sp. S45]|jgi:HlyD family secretion protein|uniref:efflux RND transporter periplasmic adaptor subunit n=1 Tax=Caulobacter sp. S45 TaxID=1641861 RepID=UPI001C202C06|nr:HlyD family efflux transporter periplasmic adaptor subunit [Caulobacter sp. S45]